MRAKATQSTALTMTTADDAASLRKRKQNRISQQCLREKKSAAASGFFEKLGADIRALRDGCERSGQIDAAELLAINEGLVEENRNLREALLRMRKKLLSLSSAADCAADDPIFQKMLAKEPEPAETGSNGNGLAPNKRRKCSTSSARNGRFGSSDPSVEGLSHRDAISLDETLVDSQADSSDSVTSSAACRQLDPQLGADQQPDLSLFSQDMAASAACSDFPASLKSSHELFTNLAFPISSLPQISMPNSAVLEAWMNRSYANFLAQKIENVCVRYALKSRVCEVDRGDGVKQTAVIRQTVEREMVERLADIVVHMMFDASGLGQWIDTLDGAREFLRSVVTCRIMLGCAKPPDVTDDLETDCPPWSTSTRPLIVDMIAWPSLRDQMMFHSNFYDLDEMTEDVINSTVVDIPEQHIALQLYSHPPSPFPTVPRPDDDTSERKFRFSQNEFTLKILQMQNQELYDIVAQRMDAFTSEDSTAHPCCRISPSPRIPAKTMTPNKVKDWKLSNTFFKKYPFLQCSSRRCSTTSHRVLG